MLTDMYYRCVKVVLNPLRILTTISALLFMQPALSGTTLWAWENNQNMSFCPTGVAVCYYAGTVVVRRGRVILKPRLATLHIPGRIANMPSIRIETGGHLGEEGTARDTSDTVDEMVRVVANTWRRARQSRPSQQMACQIDFDARTSERAAYKLFLKRLRTVLPPHTRISITALASWLLDDRWLNNAACDEACAMLFSMGNSRQEVLQLLEKRSLVTPAGIDLAIGVSATERETTQALARLGLLKHAQRLYVFNSLPWTAHRYRTFLSEAFGK